MNDTVLKQALAKMLPEKLEYKWNGLYHNLPHTQEAVSDTELLHLCWLVEELFIQSQNVAGHNMDDPDYGIWTRYLLTLKEVCQNTYGAPQHATYEQRTIALAKVKGIEIV
jgi:hypothetical protein